LADRFSVAESHPASRSSSVALPRAVRSGLEQRLAVLRAAQNADGGWGYFPGKASWLEPTAYAAMALHGELAADRAWKLLSSWQTPGGGWKPCASVPEPGWGTSLCVSIAIARNEWNQPLQNGINWLITSAGAEANFLYYWATRLGIVQSERDMSLKCWPWKPGDAGWVEPTAHALVALKQAAFKQAALQPSNVKFSAPALWGRVHMGEAQLLDVRSRDGGWNYGSPSALGVDLPSYPETTALALLGLQGPLPGKNGGSADLGKAFDIAERQLQDTPSPLGRAWLEIARRVHSLAENGSPEERVGAAIPDIMITAVEALAAPEGNHWFMKTGGA
jgi:hypothetical protein